MEPAYTRIAMMVIMTTLTSHWHFAPYDDSECYLCHQDSMSLILMIRSMEIARYLSGIRPNVLLFSSNIRYTRLNVSSNARSLYHTLVSLYSSQ